MKYEENILSSEYPFRGKILNLRHDMVELPDGRTSKREIVEHSGGVCVLALDENRNVLLVRQYRHPYREEILELPAGKVNAGENHFDCGKRELEEADTNTSGKSTRPPATAQKSSGFITRTIWSPAASTWTRGNFWM